MHSVTGGPWVGQSKRRSMYEQSMEVVVIFMLGTFAAKGSWENMQQSLQPPSADQHNNACTSLQPKCTASWTFMQAGLIFIQVALPDMLLSGTCQRTSMQV